MKRFRSAGFVLGLAVALLTVVSALGNRSRVKPIPPLDPATTPWHEDTFREGAFYASTTQVPVGIATRGSHIGGDAYQGEFVSGWFAPRPRVTVLVAGYPGVGGDRLTLEIRDARGEVTAAAFRHPDPADSWWPWTVTLPAGTAAFRVHAVDGSSGEEGWLAVSAPFVAPLRVSMMTPSARILLAFSLQGVMFIALGWSVARWLGLSECPWVNPPLVPLLAAAGVALLGYVAFWLYFAHPLAGRIFSWTLSIASAITLLWRAPGVGKKICLPLYLAALIGLFYLGLLLLAEPPKFSLAAANRFVPGMPPDNEIPRTFADRLWQGVSPKDLWGDWKSSDRPPLQAGWTLLTWPVTDGLGFDPDTAAGTAGVWFQLLWVPAVWAFAQYLGANARQAAALVCAITFNGVFLLFSVFVWPKFAAAALVMAAFLLWFWPDTAATPSVPRFCAGGVCAALGWLAHGGVAFSLLGLVPLILVTRHRIPWRSWWPAAIAFVVLALPWTAYQRFYDPPGNRLIKWHLAGVIDIDSRGALEALRDGYRQAGLAGSLHNKWSNLRMQFGGNWSRLAHPFSPANRANIRFDEFYCTIFSLSFWIFAAPIPLIQMARRSTPSPEARRACAWLMLGLAAWLALMFRPESASIHQGTMVTQLLGFALLAWSALRFNRWLFFALFVLQAVWFLLIWSPTGVGAQAFALGLTIVSGAALVALVWCGVATERDGAAPA